MSDAAYDDAALSKAHLITPDWPAPPGVQALFTTRNGGVSVGAYASLNLGLHTDDDILAVAENQRRLAQHLPAAPRWLNQVHGHHAVAAHEIDAPPRADASFTDQPDVVCAVLIADCMPVLLCTDDGTVVAAVHCGWRGLAGGVIDSTLVAMNVDPKRVIAWLGPAIGPKAFEVGADVRAAFLALDPANDLEFAVSTDVPDKWFADLFALGRRQLARAGVGHVYGGGVCTVSDPQRFFSYRRERVTGRMAAMVWRTG
ncbi:MAG: peptidoglycan editing factor PgeF [Proteobacteria bacterium]|nr:peptidoglycan editing factor PgeF [Burkholderiales bacterium]